MPENSLQILSTKVIGDSVVNAASIYNISIDQIPFIVTEETITPVVAQQIQQLSLQSHFVVFTSINSVKAVQTLITLKPSWKIFCIAHKTKELVENILGTNSIIDTAFDGAALAERIIANGSVKKVIFFCGNQRRDELPEKLKKHGIEVEEITVYKTIEKPTFISKKYDGFLFFSPSAIRSFFSVNTIEHPAQIFVIGNTTANEFKKYSHLPVIISEQPLAENLACQAIKHFLNLKTS